MRRRRPSSRGGVVIALAVAIGLLALIGLLAVCTPGEDDHSLGRVELVSHECDPYNEPCGDEDYDQWNNRDENRNRNRNRGAFSPGPFDRSPVEMHDVCISLDCSGREKDRRDEPRPEARASLFPIPTPDGVRQFVVSTVQAGVGLGRLFADATIDFVSGLLLGIA